MGADKSKMQNRVVNWIPHINEQIQRKIAKVLILDSEFTHPNIGPKSS